MKVLFVSSGNRKNGRPNVIVEAQGESLQDENTSVDYFAINSKGIKGYIKYAFELRKFLKKNKYDIIHAHYSLSGFCATLAGAKSLIVSLMGSDVMASNSYSKLIEFCSKFFWKATIVKSDVMNKNLKLSNLHIIPNGVNLSLFKPIDKQKAREELNFIEDKKYIIFVSNPERYEKNYKLAESAVLALNEKSVELLPVFNMEHEKIVKFMHAADALIFTSLWEGSPNVIKEAMACNCPIVSVDVGDVKEVIEGVENCYLAEYDAKDIADKLKLVLANNGKRTNGREKILKMGLDSESVAKRIISVYKSVVK